MRVLSVDLGASSGRCIVSELTDSKKIKLTEVKRFENGVSYKNGHFCWNLDKLWQNVWQAIEESVAQYDDIISIAVDSWAIDFVCLSEKDEEMRPFISYRDERTKGKIAEFCTQYNLSIQDIFTLTAAQLMEINSLYQLFAMSQQNPDEYKKIQHILMIPDWFHFKLTGIKSGEFTNASTTQMLEAKSQSWSKKICQHLGLDINKLPPIYQAGDILGHISEDLQKSLKAKQKIAVTLPATHDTASAVVAVPTTDKNPFFISLGTWAVVGQEVDSFDVDLQNIDLKIGNEGGIFNSYRKTKNVTGLWLIQNIKKELCPEMSYADIVKQALAYPAGQHFIHPNDESFANPASMKEAIALFCAQTEQEKPQNIGAFARCIFESLACSLADALGEIAQKEPIKKVYIIGGGAQNHFLCQSLANILNVEVSAGPYEATAIGNAAMQFIGQGAIADIFEARKIIIDSFDCFTFKPKEDSRTLYKNYHKALKRKGETMW